MVSETRITPSEQLNATGTPSSTTFLRGDNSWTTPAGGAFPGTPTVSAATTLTLAGGVSAAYVFSGGSATVWTLPAVTGNTGQYFLIENRGSAAITLNAAGADHLWFLSSLTSVTIAVGASLQVLNDGTYWNTLSIDLVNDTVGILPTANGGTGQAN